MALGKKRVIFFNLLLPVGFFILLMGGLEINLRLMGRTSDNFLKQDPVLGWVHMPNKKGWSVTGEYRVPVELNRFGLVGPEVSDRRQVSEGVEQPFRIAILGDSVTEAFQVEPALAYPRLLEKRLNDLSGYDRYEVLNFGVTSYGTVKEAYVLEKEVMRFSPDLVILGFFVGNDFTDSLGEEINPEAKFSPRQKISNGGKLWLRNHSTAYRWFLEKKARHRFWSDPAPVSSPVSDRSRSTFDEDDSVEVQRGRRRVEMSLKKMQIVLAERQIPFLILILPSKEQVHERRRALSRQDLDRAQPSRLLAAWLAGEKIAYVDALPDFQSWAKINPESWAFFKFDGHPNETGHFLIAKTLINYLIKELRISGYELKR